jgi:predicted RNA-binding protein YlxR (DUF448 family)
VGSRDSLLRIVASPDGNVSWDRAGGAPGRGAYVCSTMECVERALQRGRMSRALRAEIDGSVLSELKKEFATTA